MKAAVATPYYDVGGRKYMVFLIGNKLYNVKVPFRYGRVMCRVEGLKTVQELVKGDEVEIVHNLYDCTSRTSDGTQFPPQGQATFLAEVCP